MPQKHALETTIIHNFGWPCDYQKLPCTHISHQPTKCIHVPCLLKSDADITQVGLVQGCPGPLLAAVKGAMIHTPELPTQTMLFKGVGVALSHTGKVHVALTFHFTLMLLRTRLLDGVAAYVHVHCTSAYT